MTVGGSQSGLSRLRTLLLQLAEGPVPDERREEIVAALETAWNELDGSDVEGTTAEKINDPERLHWKDPVLSFIVERHGRTVLGSTRADMHHWSVDVANGTADCSLGPYRQIAPLSPRVDTKVIAEEIASRISARQNDPRLKWTEDRSTVRVLVGDISALGGFKQTREGRRKRFRRDLEHLLGDLDWRPLPGSRPYTYSRKADPE
jgi:hypothetical protein